MGYPEAGRRSCIGLLAALLCMQAQATDPYPSRPVKLVVPYPAGGGTDALARALADKLGKSMGQTFIVENKAGAGSTLGAETVKNAPPDGYTLLVGDNGMIAYPFLHEKPSSDATKDFVHAGLVANAYVIMVSAPSLPMNTLSEVLKASRAEPDRFAYAVPGLGNYQHMLAELLNQKSGLRLRAVPYRGTAPAVQDVLSARVEFGFFGLATAMPLIRGGKLKAYAISSPERIEAASDIPTFKEQGLPEMHGAIRYFLSAPRGTPKPIVDRLSAELGKALSDPELIAFFDKNGVEPGSATGEAVSRMFQTEQPVWSAVFRAAGLKPGS